MDKRKAEWVRNAPTEVLERITSSLIGNEVKERSPEFPLGGIVHLSGVGQVEVKAIRAELARRQEAA